MDLYFLTESSPLQKVIESLQSNVCDRNYFTDSRFALESSFNVYPVYMKNQEEYDSFVSLMYEKLSESTSSNIFGAITRTIESSIINQNTIDETALSEVSIVQIINDNPKFLESILSHPSKAEYFRNLIKANSEYFSFTATSSEAIRSIDKLIVYIDNSSLDNILNQIDKLNIESLKRTLKYMKTSVIYRENKDKIERTS